MKKDRYVLLLPIAKISSISGLLHLNRYHATSTCWKEHISKNIATVSLGRNVVDWKSKSVSDILKDKWWFRM